MTPTTAKKSAIEQSVTEQIIAEILKELGPPTNDIQTEAFTAFDTEDYAKVRILAASNLSDSYVRALTYLCSVPKNPPTLAVLAAEACRAAADWQKEFTTQKLSAAMAKAFKNA